MTDEEIRKELARRKNRKDVKRRLIIAGIICVLAIAGGLIAGSNAGANRYKDEVSIKNDVTEDTPLVDAAIAEVGNKGGDKFWSWYGFESRVEWCACYISWCEETQGYISEDIAPKFAMVKDGAEWFKDRDQWLGADTTPSANDLIFFDWDGDGVLDHVGIVTGVVDDKIYTVEGNSSDRCRQKRYTVGAPVIAGYGRIAI